MNTFHIKPINSLDRKWLARFLEKHWRSTKIVTRGRVYSADELAGFVARQDDQPVGLVTYRIEGEECEIITINSLKEGGGIGSALVSVVRNAAISANCNRLWLITTNDNLDAMRFYQKRGFSFVTVHRSAIEESRRLKPEIPLIGKNGIPIRDEIEFEMLL